MNDKLEKVCTTLNQIEYFLILASAVTACVSISVFVSLLGISIGIKSLVMRLKIFEITLGIRRYRSIIEQKEEKENIK